MLGISRISIKNFRQFKSVDLVFDDKQGVFLFIGKNGMGKSNFLNAICWCLYEKQPFKFHDEEKGLLNENLAKLNPNEEVKVSIEITQDDKTFLLQRSLHEREGSSFLVMIKKGENWDPIESPSLILNNFLPESVSRFFFFDGEAVQNLFKGNYAHNLKQGIMKVSNVELLDKSFEHLEKTEIDYRRMLSRDIPETETLNAQLTDQENYKKTYQINLDKKQAEMIETKENKNDLMGQLAIHSKYKDLQTQRESLNLQLENTEERLNIYQKQINDSLMKNAAYYFISDHIVELRKKIVDSSSKGQLPPKIKGDFIKELIDLKECICGNKIAHDSSELKHLNKLLDEVQPLDNRAFLLEDKAELNMVLRELKEWPFHMRDIRARIAKERQEKETIQQKLREISNKLQGSFDIGVGNLERTVQIFETQTYKLQEEIGSLKSQILNCEKSIRDITYQLDKLNSEKNKNKNTQLKYDFIKEAKDKIFLIRKKLIDEIRESVSIKTSKYFKHLMWDHKKFESIKFSEDYSVFVVKTGDEINHFKRLSVGQTKMLALATIKSLAELSGFKGVPAFIDGPLEALDEEVKTNFLDILPNYMPDKQLFVFSTDYPVMTKFGSEHVKKNNFYKLIQENDGTTSIKLYLNSI